MNLHASARPRYVKFAWLCVLAIGVAWSIASRAGVITCTTGLPGGSLSSCTDPGFYGKCLEQISDTTLVRAITSDARHVYEKWNVIPSTAQVRTCTGWATKATAPVSIVQPPPPPPPPDPAPEPPSIGIGNELTWQSWDDAPITGYRVYVGTTSGVYGAPIDVGNVQRWSTAHLAPGTYYFAVTALTARSESARSAEVSKTIRAPDPPKQFACSDPVVTDNKTVSLTCALE